tara:strand:- start:46 stop:573 length:528 start_codon:yes stop_codon:yes gene_type:complete
MIVCCDNCYGIGKNNTLPWNIPCEMKHFKDKTIGLKNNCVIMGKNTFLSIPSKYAPLIHRHNVVITRDKELVNKYKNDPTITILSSPDDIISFYNNTSYNEYWIIGGKMLYEYTIKRFSNDIKEIHISFLNENYECDLFLNIENELNKDYSLKEKIKYEDFNIYIFTRRQNMDCP